MILFFSSFMSPHIRPICDYIYAHTKGKFQYIETSDITNERRDLGYAAHANAPYIINLSNEFSVQKKMADDADIVLITPGSAPMGIVYNRIKSNKPTFFICERIFKRGLLKLFDSRTWMQYKYNLLCRGKQVYLLCMGSYVAQDYKILGFNRSKCLKFGYFPEHEISYLASKEPIGVYKIIWVGRLIDWKRPFWAVKLITMLIKNNIKAELVIVGTGKLKNSIENYIIKHGFEDIIHIVGMKRREEVYKLISEADVLLITSNRREGWGAVINEALSVGTPVVSGDKIGATKYLLKDGFNGKIYNTGSRSSLYKSMIELIQCGEYMQIRRNARETIDSNWNYRVAGERLLHCIKQIQEHGKIEPYNDGPLSRAD